ncbi:MAG TPA: type I glyceraldehyde-3-phosphate dehydrogenase [Chloroflexota bacterium]|nr:type I glyceraldehyde-3-phosphate dehydrogenase [Chloroflexota bacterium]
MATRVGINGLGRIGSLVLRAGLDYPDLQFVAVNDLTEPDMLAYLFEFNSVHGAFDGTVEVENDALVVDGERIRVFHEKDPAQIPWRDVGVDVVIESTGMFENLAAASKHMQAGAKKVIITAPAKDVPTLLVMGINEDMYNPQKDDVVAMGSCTTYALAPVLKVMNDQFGVTRAMVNTTHAYTNTQALLDKPVDKNMRRSRAAAINIVPTTTGAVRAVTKALPEMKDKIDGVAVRVPVPDGSLIDLTFIVSRPVTVEEVNNAFEDAAQSERLSPYLAAIDKPIVSTDVIGVDQSSIVDLSLTMVNGELVKVFSWYDNEWSFALRVNDVTSYIAEKLSTTVGAHPGRSAHQPS